MAGSSLIHDAGVSEQPERLQGSGTSVNILGNIFV